MTLAELPLVIVLVGLAAYTTLGGADFGAGMWQLTAGRGPAAERLRDHANHALAPVWEANHVWLVFVLTVAWTAYPVLVGAVASTMVVPLSLAALGVLARGAAYALHAGTRTPGERRRVDAVFGAASVLTPFALGAVVGGVVSMRVPVGNAAGGLWTSWLNPSSLTIGMLAVVLSSFLAAVHLAADAGRVGAPDLERRFRARALASGVLAGVIALGGLVVLRVDAPVVGAGLLRPPGLVALVLSAGAGLATLGLVAARRHGAARLTATLAVAAVVAGWGLAQRPVLLPGLTVDQAAAPAPTLVGLLIAVAGGAVVLAPSLGLLFTLVLRGRFDPATATPPGHPEATRDVPAPTRSHTRRSSVAAVGLLVAGTGLLTVAESGQAHAVGVVVLAAAAATGVAAARPWSLAGADPPRP
ncbi:cytochrome d ubiquinol oxidase subunit II [Actinomycetospora sp. TBRC 11914]|uniref:cytochrome d ubiquinol oxidase subunit II n=1 Tax=Actinomycetospora sp. TBRC 11914 TaxID=2729387 RepID=UPI001B7D6030|nr:cytochrome d ubiquinol oxidase subunit II [Actinomycetospora sp. TBRC 11914]